MAVRTFHYSNETRLEAIECFERGLGYKATANELGIPQSTTRDWRRKWAAQDFSANNGLVGMAAYELMKDNQMRYVATNQDKFFVTAYRNATGQTVSVKTAKQRVICAMQYLPELFEETPMAVAKIEKAPRMHRVFRLIDTDVRYARRW